jgi:hypothetical protein
MASHRDERLAANEARFREINESAQPQRKSQGEGRFVCECADRSCSRWITMTATEYAAVREHPRHFLVLPGHENPEVENIVERHVGYFVIEKPEEVAHVLEQTG